MKRIVLFLLFLGVFVPGTGAQEPSSGNELITLAAALRMEQVGLKDVSLRIVEILVGGEGILAPEERASLEAVNRRLTAAGTVASYEASRLEMLVSVREDQRSGFARRLADELQSTTAALAVDAGIVRDRTRKWSPQILGRVGAPEEAIQALRLSLESALLELKKLAGETI